MRYSEELIELSQVIGASTPICVVLQYSLVQFVFREDVGV